MTQRIDLLTRLMPPHPGAGDTVDWDPVERSWGTRFPGDYKEFIARYGAGAISDYLVVIPPESRAEKGAEPAFQGMEEETLNALQFWRAKAPGEAGRDRVIAWGIDSSADVLCWHVTGDDPDAWPVVVWNQDDVTWREYPCGAVEFLCRVLARSSTSAPSGASLSGVTRRRAFYTAMRNSDSVLPASTRGQGSWTLTLGCSATDTACWHRSPEAADGHRRSTPSARSAVRAVRVGETPDKTSEAVSLSIMSAM